MKCSSCKKDNPDGAKVCKFCGGSIGSNFRVCDYGHNFDANLLTCPYCPSASDKTVMDSSSDRDDKTQVDTSGPVLRNDRTPAPGNFASPDSDKTILGTSNPSFNSAPAQNVASRKLVGWLATFDISPNGTDFRITEGRIKIGRSSRNDIVIAQPGISDEHCIMLYRDGKLVIQDNLSSNGTIVNGVSIDEKVYLNDNDIIKLGGVTLKVKIL